MINLMETIDEVITGPKTPETFSGWVKCDACVAQSMWKVSGDVGEPLFLCGHHKNKFATTDKFNSWAKEFITHSEAHTRT